ncbi:MAG: protein translocase subunit SecDF [Cyclobacteriaceae bacterium]|nr:MAG: protein translocase subunit SecDF [Cyclobacteriaceae bacterium]
MQNKGFVIVLTAVISALCLYYLSFTVVSTRVQQNAIAYATDANGVVDLNKKVAYIDSVWNKPVYNLFGVEYTYKEVKDNELSLGLDLQGGMHVTLEVSPVDILRSLSGNSRDSAFVRALNKATQMQKNSQENFTTLFFRAFREDNPDVKLAHVFASTNTRGRISLNDPDEKVIEVVEQEVESAIDRSYTILKNRLDQFGTSAPNIQRLPGTGRIQIEIPGADNPARVRKLLQGVARLEFWDVIEPNTIMPALVSINDLLVKEKRAQAAQAPEAMAGQAETKPDSTLTDLEKQLQAASTADSARSGLDSLQNLAVSPLFAKSIPQGTFRYPLKDTAEINRIFRRADVRSLLPRNVGIYWANKPDKDLSNNEALQLYFLDLGRTGKPRLTGEVINDARQDLDEYARPAVSMTMNATGTRIWAKWTAEASSKSPRGRIAIVLDNLVYSAPVVNGEIPNGNSQISGNFTVEEAKDLANILKAGSLPAPTRIVEEAIVGPTLGEIARNQGLISTLAGLALVVIFMVIYYARGGWVANLALLFNIFFILGILAQFDAALTLPGIAGIVLTMGMAVDANVLIFERIKEELYQHGRKMKDAIKTGYQRAFWTIFDSNFTTLITAVLLAWVGQGPIRGFAVTLIIGILTSFFTAVYVSRVIVEWMTRKGDESKISFDTFIARMVKKRRRYAFVRNSKLAYITSSVIIIVGLVLIVLNGLTLGVDFKGGRSYVVSFNQPVKATELKVGLSEAFANAGTEVKNYGSNSKVKVTTAYLIDDDSDEADDKVRQALIAGMEKITGKKYAAHDSQLSDNTFTISSSTKVGATVADDIKNSAWKASLLSLAAIFAYILLRFRKWQFSTGAILATVHDTLFVFAAFAIAGAFGISFEVDQVFVAAVLTIIGYSINDTVIIFDRIREYFNLGTSHDDKKIVNDAINDTLSRTIITAGTTLLVVLVLLIFGGEVLRGFSFALFVGIVVGTYSSVFIAAPAILDLGAARGEKKPESKKAVPATA